MLLKSLKFLALPVAMIYASSAYAFFDVEALVGKRWYQWKDDPKTINVASQEIDVAAHIDPIPLVPVAFGAKIGMGSLNKGDFDGAGLTADTASTFSAGLDVMAWVPMVPIVTPYARLTIPVMSNMLLKGKSGGSDFDGAWKVSGYDLALGVKYSPLPVIKILAEVGKGMEKAAPDKVKSAGQDVTSSMKSADLDSSSFLLGVEIGL